MYIFSYTSRVLYQLYLGECVRCLLVYIIVNPCYLLMLLYHFRASNKASSQIRTEGLSFAVDKLLVFWSRAALHKVRIFLAQV